MVVAGATDEDAWTWCVTHGHLPTEEQIKVWNAFMTKGGWRDELTERLQRRLREGGYEDRTDVQTMFDYMDLDEGRKK